MGKKLIIKGADFSENGIPTVETELIYDSITGYTQSGIWDSDNGSAISVPPAANVSGRKITSVVLKKGATAINTIAIAKYNTQTGTYTVLATISKEKFNANETTEVSLGTGVLFGSNELLMVGATAVSSGGLGLRFAMATGNQSANFGRYTLMKTGVLNDVTYTTALMCKIYAEIE